MNDIRNLLRRCNELGVKLWAEDGRLRFRAPQGVMTEAVKSELRDRKAELLEVLGDQADSIPRLSDRSSYPLSHAQRRVWVLSQFEAGSAAYNIPLHQKLEGPLDRSALEMAFAQVVQRHESLRTTIIIVDGEPRQKVHDRFDEPLRFFDLTDHDDPEAAAIVLAREHAQQPFDLERGPLFRAALLRLDEQRHALLLTIHHIVCDGVSIGILARELTELYKSMRRGEKHSLPPLRIQYRDYAGWQLESLDRNGIAAERDFWRNELSGKLPVLDLLTDYPRPPVQSYGGRELYFELDARRLAQLRELCRQENASLFMTLLAALKVLLHRSTGQEDIIVGSPVAGRHHPDLENQVGLYLNTIVLRDRLNSLMSFRETLRQIRQTTARAFDHQVYPFDHLIGDLNVERDLSRSPLFDVMMILQNQEDNGCAFDDVRVSPFNVHPETSKTELTFCFKEQRNGLFLAIEYNTDLFRENRVRRIGGHFLRLLNSALDEPDRSIHQLQMLSDDEREELLIRFNQTQVALPAESCVVALFESQVSRTADAVAVVADDGELTYRELNLLSDRLAHKLRALGARPEQLIGIFTNRSAAMIVGLLGILKSGAAYVPLDPAFPAERLAFMLGEAEAKILVTEQALLGVIPALPQNVICLDDDLRASAQYSTQPPERWHEAGNLAYVIYTSGSTGQPKGVQISHKALANCLRAMAQRPGLIERDVFLAVTTLSFDIAALEIFLPLITGARLVIASREVAADAVQLRQQMDLCRATVMQATPATWRMLVTAGWKGWPELTVLCGGEALPCDLADELLDHGTSLWNLYGPTETTIWSAAYQVAADRERDNGPVEPLGAPIDNTQLFVLDRWLQPVPLGVPGELYIGGDGLARGYFNRPELTAEKFIPHPFGSVPGARLYRTGDVVAHRGNGRIEFLGRCDHQIKIRGYRIELGAIEAVLCAHEGVRQAVVIARQDKLGDDSLIAYYASVDGKDVSNSELRGHSRADLPDYMVPTLFVRLDTFPMTPNGKVDRNALAAAEDTAPRPFSEYVAPRDDWERGVAAIWCSVLGIERAGIHDNFFEVGGHSLKATRLIFKLEQELGVTMPLIEVFRNSTLHQLAAAARSRRNAVRERIQPIEEPAAGGMAEQQPGVTQIAPASVEELEMLNE